MEISNYKRIHLIGIGGVGMSAIAWILLKMGFEVSGSDLSENRMTIRLKENGAKIFNNHDASNVTTSDLVVISSAIKDSNPEYRFAKEKNIPICHRSDILAFVLSKFQSITCAGTHGKTTTTSLTSLLFEHSGLDPVILIGGEINDIGGNAKFGKGTHAIAEADESDGTFIKYFPKYSVITNIDADHLDHYKDINEIRATFKKYINQTQKDGIAFLCVDDQNIKDLLNDVKVNYKTYSVRLKEADIRAENISLFFGGSRFTFVKDNVALGEIELSVPGIHNVSNSLAAIGVALESGVPFEKIPPILKMFKGVRRRFEIKGVAKGITVIDDYAHHPTEINATLKALDNIPAGGRAIVMFQPHRYSRTQALAKEFAEVLSQAQILFLTDVYSAGEYPIDGVNGELLYNLTAKIKQSDLHYCQDKNNLPEEILNIIREGDVVITIGAGDIWKIGEKILAKLNEQSLVNV